VLKPKHSGFFDTSLDTLLEALRIRRVILTGINGDIGVLFTANDAYMRELKIFAPADCIVSKTAAINEQALRHARYYDRAKAAAFLTDRPTALRQAIRACRKAARSRFPASTVDSSTTCHSARRSASG
jgi:isochorismate hydrolase